MNPNFKTIDDYLAVTSEENLIALEKLRQQIKKIAPQAEEYFYYQLPAFRLDGKRLVAFGAAMGGRVVGLLVNSLILNPLAALIGYYMGGALPRKA